MLLKGSSKKYGHPFERMLIEMGIKHRYTRPYRPQTNGKAERFWRTIEEDLFYETSFDSVEQIKDELLQYLVYYNHERPHNIQGLPSLVRDHRNICEALKELGPSSHQMIYRHICVYLEKPKLLKVPF